MLNLPQIKFSKTVHHCSKKTARFTLAIHYVNSWCNFKWTSFGSIYQTSVTISIRNVPCKTIKFICRSRVHHILQILLNQTIRISIIWSQRHKIYRLKFKNKMSSEGRSYLHKAGKRWIAITISFILIPNTWKLINHVQSYDE